MDSINNSETFQANSYLKIDGKFNESLLEYKDFNNFETSNRKLIINTDIVLWVHDEIVSQFSDLYNEKILLTESNIHNLDNMSLDFDKISKKKVLELKIELFDNSELEIMIFDIFLWIYTKDLKKIKKYTIYPKHFLKIICLGGFLKLNSSFYEQLLSNIKFSWESNKNEIFKNELWNRTKINFGSIDKIIRNMDSTKEIKIYAMINWLNNGINIEKDFIISESYLSDSYKIKELIKELDLTKNLSYNQVKSVYSLYKSTLLDFSSLEVTPIIKEFLTEKVLQCIVCENEFRSYLEVINDKICKGKTFHPKTIKINSNTLSNEKYECLHSNCNNKIRQDTYSCCHKIINSENSKKGCIHGFGKHQLIIKDKKS